MKHRYIVVGGVLALAVAGGAPATSAVVHHAASKATTDVMTEAVPAGPGETAFIKAILADLGAPATAENMASMEAWIRRETSWPPVAANNPMNSTLVEPGSTNFNTIVLADGAVIHVQNYPDAAEGAAANAGTITNGHYPQITADLKAGAGICNDPGTAAEFLTWSGNGYTSPDC